MDNIQVNNKYLILKKLSKRIKIISWILAAYFIIPSVFVIVLAVIILSYIKPSGDMLIAAAYLVSIWSILSGLVLLIGGLAIVRGFSKKSQLSGFFCTAIFGFGFLDSFSFMYGSKSSIMFTLAISFLLLIGIVISSLGLFMIRQCKKIEPDIVGGFKVLKTIEIIFFVVMIAPLLFILPSAIGALSGCYNGVCNGFFYFVRSILNGILR